MLSLSNCLALPALVGGAVRCQLLARIGEETLDTPVFVQLESGRCHVMTDCLMRYALIGQPASASSSAVKLLQLTVFAPAAAAAVTAAPVSSTSLRVYFVDDTADAFEVPDRTASCSAERLHTIIIIIIITDIFKVA